jgi:hypothetical protein
MASGRMSLVVFWPRSDAALLRWSGGRQDDGATWAKPRADRGFAAGTNFRLLPGIFDIVTLRGLVDGVAADG